MTCPESQAAYLALPLLDPKTENACLEVSNMSDASNVNSLSSSALGLTNINLYADGKLTFKTPLLCHYHNKLRCKLR